MKNSQYFSHRPPSPTTLLNDPWPGIAIYPKTRTSTRQFWQRFLPVRKKTAASSKKIASGLWS